MDLTRRYFPPGFWLWFWGEGRGVMWFSGLFMGFGLPGVVQWIVDLFS
jgi:hypothetical protein